MFLHSLSLLKKFTYKITVSKINKADQSKASLYTREPKRMFSYPNGYIFAVNVTLKPPLLGEAARESVTERAF